MGKCIVGKHAAWSGKCLGISVAWPVVGFFVASSTCSMDVVASQRFARVTDSVLKFTNICFCYVGQIPSCCASACNAVVRS